MIGLLIMVLGLLLVQSFVWSYAFDIGGYETLYKISLGISIIASICYVAWLVTMLL